MRPVRALSVFALAAALGLASAGCGPEGGSSSGNGGPVAIKPTAAVTLRYKLPKGRQLSYDYKLKLNSDGESWTDEKLTAILEQLCLGPMNNPGGSGGLQMLSFARIETERNKRVKSADGKDESQISAVSNVDPEITAAYGYDAETNRNFVASDERGNFAVTKDVRFHRVIYDSIVYLLPVLPIEGVVAGSTWKAEIPVYAGPDYLYGVGNYKGGSDFMLKVNGKVDKIFVKGGSVMAQLSWTAEGAFDSHQRADAFPPDLHARWRQIHEVKSSGRATFDITKGMITAKDGQATVTFTTKLKIGRDKNEPAWETTVTKHRLSYELKLTNDVIAPNIPARP